MNKTIAIMAALAPTKIADDFQPIGSKMPEMPDYPQNEHGISWIDSFRRMYEGRVFLLGCKFICGVKEYVYLLKKIKTDRLLEGEVIANLNIIDSTHPFWDWCNQYADYLLKYDEWKKINQNLRKKQWPWFWAEKMYRNGIEYFQKKIQEENNG
jgi:hypothetical protein